MSIRPPQVVPHGTPKQTRNLSNRGTKSYGQELQTSLVPAHNGGTWHVGMVAECPFAAVRAVIRNQEPTSYTLNALAFGASSSISSYTPTEGWVLGAFSGAASIVIPARLAAARPSHTYSDWANVQSITASNGSGFFPIHARAYIATGPFSYGGGSTTLGEHAEANANALVHNRYTLAAVALGDFTSTNQVGFSATPVDLSPVLELEFLTMQQVVTVCGLGDSIIWGGGGTLHMLGAGHHACSAISTSLRPVFWQNAGVPSTTTSQFVQRLKDMILAGARPNVLIYSAFSRNDGTPSASTIAVMRYNLAVVLDICTQYRIIPIIDTGSPETAAAWNAAADNLRKGFVSEVRALRNRSILVMDSDKALSDQATPARFIAGVSTDGTHPNDVGQALTSSILQPIIRTAVDRCFTQ